MILEEGKNWYHGSYAIVEKPDFKDLEVYEFATADREWLHCVAAHRRSQLFKDEIKKWEKYDIIAGKIADDTTNQVITAYMEGLYGEVGSERADEIAIGLLLPDKLTNQICIRTEKAMNKLSFINYKEQIIKERR